MTTIAQAGSRCARSSACKCPDEPFPHLNDAETFRRMFGVPVAA
jgi:hypothetical protein